MYKRSSKGKDKKYIELTQIPLTRCCDITKRISAVSVEYGANEAVIVQLKDNFRYLKQYIKSDNKVND